MICSIPSTCYAPAALAMPQVQDLCLDELELASLRGNLQELSCSLNFEAQVCTLALAAHCEMNSILCESWVCWQRLLKWLVLWLCCRLVGAGFRY
jgi:hypothetical protein